ncbi:OX-2 membrane glycoprotein isoform X2 [Oryctolagus cuniculus]|uniref:OX-2 membrane glycoprotein isoform X2 n=1 Tax=Oryctolagus cuniculus TaxID=9986 RepID=UPI0038798678
MGFPLCHILYLFMLPVWAQDIFLQHIYLLILSLVCFELFMAINKFLTFAMSSQADSSHRIKHKNNETAVLGGNVTIFCNLTTVADVVQITWQKIQDSLPQNIATYSSKNGEKILPPYTDRLRCKSIEPSSSFITILEVTFEDEACYKCLFNVFPHGSRGGQICLNILTVSALRTELQLNPEGFLNVLYSAVGKPAPQIALFPSQALVKPPEEQLVLNANGTVTVTKTCIVSLETLRSLGLQHLIVHLDHPLKKEEIIVPLSVGQECTSCLPVVGGFITLLCISFIGVIIFCIVQKRKKKRSKNKGESTQVPLRS